MRTDPKVPLIPPTAEEVDRMLRRAGEWRAFRNRYSMSQKEFARVLGVGHHVVTRIENTQEKRPHPSTLRKFEALKERYRAAGKFKLRSVQRGGKDR
jgi:DNA-binding transcriptional regulator YiaG